MFVGWNPRESLRGGGAAPRPDGLGELTEVIETLLAQASHLQVLLRSPEWTDGNSPQRETVISALQETLAWVEEAQSLLRAGGAGFPGSPAARTRRG